MRLLIILFVILISTNSFAQNQSPYEVTPEIEIPVTIGLFTAIGLPRLFAAEMGGANCGLECDPNNVNAFDRTVIGYHSSGSKTASDVLFFSGMLMPFGFHALNVGLTNPTDGWEGYGKDVLVLTETLATTLVLNNLLDMAVRRPRPLVYDTSVPDEERLDPNSAFSFPSGHTAVVFAMGTAYSRLYMQRHPDSPWIIPIWIGSYAAGTATGLTRIFAGEHYWTDVLAGAAMGVSTGLLIPWLHESNNKESSIGLRVDPIISPNAAGISVTIN